MLPPAGGRTVIFCFEDSSVGRLAPATTAKPAYAISCGSFRLIDWLRELGLPIFADCRPHLRLIQRLDYGLGSAREGLTPTDSVLLVNARLVPTVAAFRRLQELLAAQTAQVWLDSEGAVAMAWVPAEGTGLSAPPPESGEPARAAEPIGPAAQDPDDAEATVQRLIRGVPESAVIRSDPTTETFRWPHDLVSRHMLALPESLAWRIEHGDYQQPQDGLFVAPGVSLGQHVVIDSRGGPIVIEGRARVGPFCFLAGPVHIGAGARIIEHAALKDAVALGHTTKVGGEVEASVIEPYSNKQHHGFLGHSYLGSWINLGAGTCNSDLKNTYGTINMEYGTERVGTDMQFMGCVMGDYSKTAINTGIFTGKVIGVCSMLYGFVTSNVPSFVNYARLFGQTATLPPEVMLSTQSRMFARRQVEQRECDRQLIWDMFDLTEDERNLQAAIGL